MAAYATAERTTQAQLRVVTDSPAPDALQRAVADSSGTVVDEILGRLADLIAERLSARLAEPTGVASDEWLDTLRAAEYLGVHRDTMRRLAAERSIPSEQDGAGCKLYFRRADLDVWRCSSSSRPVRRLS